MKCALRQMLIALGQSSLLVHSFTSPQQKGSIYRVTFKSIEAKLCSAESSRSINYDSSTPKQKVKNTSGPVQKRRKPEKREFLENNFGRRRKSSTAKLLEPSVVFSNNHLILVNKPPGYHSQPNESPSTAKSTKCLLTKLKNMQLGGGASKDFLLPMHRLDQPCTGILLLAKNSKAGTRTGNAFRKHLVEKDYFCVVSGDLQEMKLRSERKENKYKVSGVMAPRNKSYKRGVLFTPVHTQSENPVGRLCHLEWEHITTISNSDDVHLIQVKTGTGAKHQVRAMLAQLLKSPICGDLRYGAKKPLPDKSVALHARSLRLPSVKLGDLDFRKTTFVAPIPQIWSQYFSLTEKTINKHGFSL